MTFSAGGLSRLGQLVLSGSSKRLNGTASIGRAVSGMMHLQHANRGRSRTGFLKKDAIQTTQMVCGVTKSVAKASAGSTILGTMKPKPA